MRNHKVNCIFVMKTDEGVPSPGLPKISHGGQQHYFRSGTAGHSQRLATDEQSHTTLDLASAAKMGTSVAVQANEMQVHACVF